MAVKCNKLSFVDLHWMIPIGEEILETYIQMSRRDHYQFMELRPLTLRKTVGNRVSWAYRPVWHKNAITCVWVI